MDRLRSRGYVVDLRSPRSTLKDPRVANGSMIMTYDKARIVSRAGRVTKQTLAEIDQALAVHLGLQGP